MAKKRLIYHKENIEKSQFMVEEFIRHEDARTLYGILKALTIAVGYILDEMEKGRTDEENAEKKL